MLFKPLRTHIAWTKQTSAFYGEYNGTVRNERERVHKREKRGGQRTRSRKKERKREKKERKEEERERKKIFDFNVLSTAQGHLTTETEIERF